MSTCRLRQIITVALFAALPSISSSAAFDIECTPCEGLEFTCLSDESGNWYDWAIMNGPATWVTPNGQNGRTGECDFPSFGGNVSGIVIRDQDYSKVESFRYVTCDLGT